MKFSFESQPNTNRGNESKDEKVPDFIELPKGEVKNPTEFRKRMTDLMKIGVLSAVSTFATSIEAQNNKSSNVTKDKSFNHEYTLDEVKDMNTFMRLMDKENQYDKNWGMSKEKFYKKEQKRLLEIFNQYEKQRQWLLSIMQSPEYKARLENESNIKNHINLEKRISNVEQDSLITVVSDNTTSDNTIAYYSSQDKRVHFSAPNLLSDIETVGVHEFTHESTDGDSLLSSKADSLYRNAFDSSMLNKKYELEIESRYKKEHNTTYYGRPTEMDARKKELEYELEKLGVKKYGDTFTKEHYQILQKLHKEGKLGEGADQFYRMIKPEYFLIIMNEIAKNDIEDGDIVSRTG